MLSFFSYSEKKKQKKVTGNSDMAEQTSQTGRGRGRLRTQQETVTPHAYLAKSSHFAEIQIRSYPDKQACFPLVGWIENDFKSVSHMSVVGRFFASS